MTSHKTRLKKYILFLSLVGALLLGYVLLDYSFNQAKPDPYVFDVPALTSNQPVLLKKDNMVVVVARYGESMLASLKPGGRISKISSSFRQQPSLVDKNGYFVTRAYGTLQGCPLLITENGFKESCSDARYNRLGISSNPGLYKNLEKVEYHFSRNHTVLTVY